MVNREGQEIRGTEKHVIWEKKVRNQKQVIEHSLKEHKKCASDVQSEADTIQEENTRFLDQVKMMQKENSEITGEISKMVANHARTEEEGLK